MSYWTNITACIVVDTNKELLDIKSYVENILKDAPKITGSEGCANVFVNVKTDHNVYMSRDCRICKYKDSYQKDDKYEWCNADENYKCPDAEYQTQVVITISGNLRDRYYELTKEEYNEFLKFLKQQDWEIVNKTSRIQGAKYEQAKESSATHFELHKLLKEELCTQEI